MNEKIFEKYTHCIRFDDGEYCRSNDYRELARKKEVVRELLGEAYGSGILP